MLGCLFVLEWILHMKGTRASQIVIAGCLLLLGGILGWFIRTTSQADIDIIKQVRTNSSQYKYINPPLFSEKPKDVSVPFKALENKLTTIADTALANNVATSVSIYFRDLNSGRWTGVNEDTLYEPSSMLKVAVMMGIYKDAQKNPEVLSHELNYAPTAQLGQYFKPLNPLKAGKHTVSELINTMIIDSDNDAMNLLMLNYGKDFSDVYDTFQLPTLPKQVEDFMSAKSYSVLFRGLYNSSYLNTDVSEKALALLASSTFKTGLIPGVPSDVLVAHKFGEQTTRYADNSVQNRQLHDCGIVYHPGHPYFLCVMTRGINFSQLEDVIQSVSKTVYDNVQGGMVQ